MKPAAMKIALNPMAVHRLAMAHMVLRHHHIAKAGHIVCKVIIPLHMLRDAVNNLQNRFGLPLRSPLAAVDFSGTTGVKPEIRSHCLSQ